MAAINSMVGSKWGLSSSKTIWAYQSLVRQLLSYEAQVWAPNISVTALAKIQQVQNLALKVASRTLRSTPMKALELIHNITPIHLFISRTAMAGRLRTKNMCASSWSGDSKLKTKKSHQRSLDKALADEGLEIVQPKMKKRQPCLFNSNLQNQSDDLPRFWPYQRLTHPPTNDPTIVYTDGSKLDNETGAGWLVTVADQVIEEDCVCLGNLASVFQAEVLAISQAAQYCTNNRAKIMARSYHIIIKSDSQAAIKALANTVTTSPVVEEAKKRLNLLSSWFLVELDWVRGHNNDTGNEIADYLAKKGSMMRTYGPQPHIVPDYNTAVSILKAATIAEWQKDWNNTKGCEHSRKFIPGPDKAATNLLRALPFNKQRIIIQCLTGHTTLNYHQHKIGQAEEPLCRLCLEDDETPDHIINDCPAVALNRQLSFIQNNTHSKSSPFKNFLEGLISFIATPSVRELFKSPG